MGWEKLKKGNNSHLLHIRTLERRLYFRILSDFEKFDMNMEVEKHDNAIAG